MSGVTFHYLRETNKVKCLPIKVVGKELLYLQGKPFWVQRNLKLEFTTFKSSKLKPAKDVKYQFSLKALNIRLYLDLIIFNWHYFHFYRRLTFFNETIMSWNYFLNVGPSKEDIFFDNLLWSIFQSSLTHITNYNFSHVGPLWAAFMYCNDTCLSDLWTI